ncbi:MAG: hypothetical protein HY866_05415 [Chloroflexi bacterium]|nr:hypothetical protein [Chloroflexota bacterium]
MRVEYELRNLPRVRVIEYLEQAGGQQIAPWFVVGAGWTADLYELEPAQVGSLCVPCDQLVIEGNVPAVERVSAFMRQKTMRGGG